MMRAVVVKKTGGPNVLKLVELDSPPVGDDEVLIRVAAAAVNRIDFDLRWCGATTRREFCPGFECSGVIKAVGAKVNQWRVGDQVCAVLHGGGYAEEVVVSARLVLPVPSKVPLTHAASLPEAACNAWQVMSIANLEPGKRLLIHECCGDIGLFVLQLAKCKGALVYATAESDEKLEFYKHLGADICINCKNEDFVAQVKESTGNKGIHVVVDSWAVNLEKNQEILSYEGKLLFVDLHGPPLAKIRFTWLMAKQAQIQVVDRWIINLDERATIVDFVKREVWPAIENGAVQPVVYKTFKLSEAAAAHRFMESTNNYQNIISAIGVLMPWLEGYAYTGKVSGHVMGKILLIPGPEKSW